MKVGDIIEVLDLVDYTVTYKGTIKMIEPDDEIPELWYLYIRANDESLNTQNDPRIGSYWTIVRTNDGRIINISPATL